MGSMSSAKLTFKCSFLWFSYILLSLLRDVIARPIAPTFWRSFLRHSTSSSSTIHCRTDYTDLPHVHLGRSRIGSGQRAVLYRGATSPRRTALPRMIFPHVYHTCVHGVVTCMYSSPVRLSASDVRRDRAGRTSNPTNDAVQLVLIGYRNSQPRLSYSSG